MSTGDEESCDRGAQQQRVQDAIVSPDRDLRRLVERTRNPVFIKDPEGRFEFVNEAAATTLGATPESIVGRYDVDFFDADDIAGIRAMDAETLAHGHQSSRRAVRYVDGERRVFVEDTYPYRDADGAVVGVMGISHDITDITDREDVLREKHDRLDEFAAIVSHDLLNPVTVAQGRLALAQAEFDSEHLDALGEALDRIESMVADTLALARQGDVVTDPEPVWLTDVVAACWAMIGADDATLRLDDEFTLAADADRLRHVFENLFRNSVVHGGPDVTVRIGRLDDGFYVEDDGPGIPEDARDDVFAPGHKSREGGTGFGLTIVRRIADAHGWSVRATAGTDGGARFEFMGVEIDEEE